MLSLDLTSPDGGQDFRQHLSYALENSAESSIRLRAGFAYATRSGVKELLEYLRDSPSWQTASKFWLLGVHHGITEPFAINALAALPNSKVRLATCGLSLQPAIEGERIFHAKVMCVDAGSRHKISTLIAGSANLTGSAIGNRIRNFEAGMAWTSTVEDVVSGEFDFWWQQAWASGITAGSASVDAYIKHRTRFHVRNPNLILDALPEETSSIAGARILWIEAGAMKTGGSNNAIDLSAELAEFFGPLSDQRRLITLSTENRIWSDRPLSPKTTTLNVPLWRLSLPTQAMEGFDYRNRTICFTRITGGKSCEFRLAVADIDSQEARKWQTDSGRHGFIRRTGGGHTYGVRVN